MGPEERWGLLLRHLADYRDQHGHVDVPRGFRTETGAGLGAWVHRQRTLHARGTLPRTRVAQLHALGLRWVINDRSRAIDEYLEFVAQHGHGRVPSSTVTTTGFPLGTWVQSRRRQYHQNPVRAQCLWPELTRARFLWQIRDPDAQWQAGFQALKNYQAVHGDCLVPASYVTSDGFLLGRWVDTRRTEYRAGVLDPAKLNALDTVGMVWWLREVADTAAREARELAHFRRCCDVFATYIATTGTVWVPTRYTTEDGMHLGRWLLRQRQLLRHGALSPERIDILDSISTIWNAVTTGSRRGRG